MQIILVGRDYLRAPLFGSIPREIHTTVVSEEGDPLGRLADQHLVANLDDPTSVDRAVQQAMKLNLGTAGILCLRDNNIPDVARLARQHGIIGISERAAMLVRSKLKVRRLADSSGLFSRIPARPIPSSMASDEAKALLQDFIANNGPCFVKPDSGSCSVGVEFVESTGQLDHILSARQHHLPEFGDFLVEGDARGDDYQEISIETALRGGEIQQFFTRKLPRQKEFGSSESGHVTVETVPKTYREAGAAVAALHEALELDNCLTHTEVMLSAGGQKPALIELNCRPPGDLIPILHEYTAGVNLWAMAISIATGTPWKESHAPYNAAGILFAPPGSTLDSELPTLGSQLGTDLCYGIQVDPTATGCSNNERSGFAVVAGKSEALVLRDLYAVLADAQRKNQ